MTLHRCGTPWKFGPCWRVQKALKDAGLGYELVRGPWLAKNRTAVIEGTGQRLYPAIRFDDGSWYREESRDMARAAARVGSRAPLQAAAGIARSDDRYATLLGRHPLPLGLTATGPVKLGKAPSWKA